MSRRSAIALIVKARTTLLANTNEQLSANAQHHEARVADLTRLLFDVRAGRVDTFVLKEPTPMHVTVAAD
ncbi:hypothetical protein ACFSHT_07095 [Paraburkholderia silviterrae]|uniref:Uncharacterized protein n=1 Tax=Paraburkholderia silviterrae TaxID=2528715 RepID=A0A4R5MCI2_9BURK|nr:hypothetical protein [Paraburkholderia silviterrae]TDG24658.1 hypothetical protein EYW47_08895 [Paraburkholderia silviterrae]